MLVMTDSYRRPTSLTTPKNTDDYHALAKSKRLEWIGGTLPKNTNTKTRWKCKLGHITNATFKSISRNNNCTKCGKVTSWNESRKKTAQDYHDLAAEKNIEWIGHRVPPNTNVATLWQCERGHKTKRTYQCVKHTEQCLVCYQKNKAFAWKRRITADDYYALEATTGFKLIGSVPRATNIKTTWVCARGHKVFKCYQSVKREQSCKECHRNRLRTGSADQYSEFAKRIGLTWIGETMPVNNMADTKWRCDLGCEFERPFHRVRYMKGCPSCKLFVNGKRASEVQLEIAKLINGVVNYGIGNQRVDIALVEERIAIEYDGWHWHAHRSAEDRTRNRNIKQAGWKLLVIKSNSRTPTLKQLEFHLTKLRAGESKRVMRLSDWGVGNTIADRRTEPKDER
jgi:hypothetical protein